MKNILRLVAISLGCLFASTHASLANAAMIVALTQNNELLQFDSATPGATSAPVAITGIASGFRLVGMDLRPANNLIYGLAINSNNAISRLYTLNRSTGAATLAATLSESISGANFGVDFNPVADRLRVVSNTGQNYRINVATGETFIDSNVAYATTDANAGRTPNVVASAYTNNFAGATSTTLYNLDLTTQSLVTQIPPNNGTLNTIGALNQAILPDASFDIDGATNQGFAVLNGSTLSSINLATGAVSVIGNVGSTSSIVSITAVPEPTSLMLLATVAGGVGLRVRGWRRKSIVR